MGQNILHSVFEFLFLVPSLFTTGGRRRRAFMPRGFAARFCKQSLDFDPIPALGSSGSSWSQHRTNDVRLLTARSPRLLEEYLPLATPFPTASHSTLERRDPSDSHRAHTR